MIRARRHWMLAGAAGTAALAAARLAGAQEAPREGRDYRRVVPAQPTDVPAGKIEVIEFFWYGCPHCNALEPFLQEWAKKLPPDVVLRRVHVPFGDRRHQQLYYTLVAMGRAGALNDKVFHAIHVDNDRLDTPEKMTAMLSRHGVDPKQFMDVYNSFAVRTAMRRAAQVSEAYGIEGVPSFGVAGKYITAPSMAGSNQAALRVVDWLVARERQGAK